MLKEYKMLSFVVVFLAIGMPVLFAVEKPTTASKTCVTSDCHNTYSQKERIHGPVAVGDCKSCHKFADEQTHQFSLVREQKELCNYCHLDQGLDQYTHQPLIDGDCVQCHDPHASDFPFLLSTARVSDLCQNCHDVARNVRYLHGPVAAGQCTLCHNSHGSDYENLLTEAPGNELCFSCHEVTKSELEKLEFVHEPVKDLCTNCHDVHGSNHAMLLQTGTPEMCFQCHQEVKEQVTQAQYQHSIVMEDGGCIKCHTPHASSVRFGLKADPKTLCGDCHNKPIEDRQGKTMGNLHDELDGKKFLHGPVQESDCQACHRSHGGENFRLLIKQYPPEFYAPFNLENYSLCFSCHPQNLVLAERGVELTEFRNGNWNLHYLHVNKTKRGRTCRACHANISG